MARDYFKGEKKKQKKQGEKVTDTNWSGVSNTPTYTMPEVIEKKKNSY